MASDPSTHEPRLDNCLKSGYSSAGVTSAPVGEKLLQLGQCEIVACNPGWNPHIETAVLRLYGLGHHRRAKDD